MYRVKVFERWMYRNPEEIIDRLLERSRRRREGPLHVTTGPPEVEHRDRYYTQARKLEVRKAMREASQD
jgi:uncharacterized Fe-S cluster-containing radical SAM superfamily protein